MPSDPLDVASRAEQLREAGRPDQALDVLTEALAEHPGSPLLLVELSSVRRVLGDLPGAEQAVRAALQQAPQFTLALLRLTMVLVQQNRMPEAIDAAESLLAVDAEAPAGWAYLGLARTGLRGAGERLTARPAVRRALELAPDDPTYRYLAAIVEDALGNTVGARQLVEQGLSMDPQSPSLLALRAEYAPVAEQPALLVDVLAANPGDVDSRELLDAAVTWERRLALTTVAVLPPLVAVAAAAGRSAPATTITAVLALVAGALVLGRFRRRRDVLPAGYLASRAAAARGGAVMRVLVIATGASWAAGTIASWIAPDAATALVLAGVPTGWGAVVAVLPDDARVLAVARRRRGRTRWGTAWRYGGLRQELALWTGLAIGVIALVGVPVAARTGGAGALPSLLALAGCAGVTVQLVDAVIGGVNAPHGYLRTVAVRYRFAIACVMAFALLLMSFIALVPEGFSDSPAPETTPLLPIRPQTPIPFPTFSFPSSFPSIDVSLTPSPTARPR